MSNNSTSTENISAWFPLKTTSNKGTTYHWRYKWHSYLDNGN